MKIEINLDETRFKDLVDDELGRFSNKELHDIIKKAIGQYAIEKDVIKEIFYQQKYSYYGGSSDKYELTPRMETLFKEIAKEELEPTMKKTEENIKSVLNEEDIIKRLTENLFYRVVTNRINDMIWRDGTLEALITTKANRIIDEKLNQH